MPVGITYAMARRGGHQAANCSAYHQISHAYSIKQRMNAGHSRSPAPAQHRRAIGDGTRLSGNIYLKASRVLVYCGGIKFNGLSHRSMRGASSIRISVSLVDKRSKCRGRRKRPRSATSARAHDNGGHRPRQMNLLKRKVNRRATTPPAAGATAIGVVGGAPKNIEAAPHSSGHSPGRGNSMPPTPSPRQCK